ncbi:MAG: 5-formyltetrahydrofolate cyclo-ligase [Haliea sp.]|nr:5-formyltetrahydrofolate cyclo-ligase [Haliea sp.]|tara:strand:+ start:61665 stop:62282 length:618 start_codon:yes stop_codon:yes gene_type:complete
MPETPIPETPTRGALRLQLRQKRLSLPDTLRESAARNLESRLANLECWQSARVIAGYWPNDGEIDPLPLLRAVREAGRQVCLPVLAGGNTLHFREWLADAVLVKNRFGIPEPPATARALAVAELDIVLMPLVGWSRDGTRLGMGGGFYDRSLAGTHAAVRIGLGFDCQEVEALPRAHWDVPLDYVVTETGLYCCNPAHHQAGGQA